jgi:DNA-binding protein YbaB
MEESASDKEDKEELEDELAAANSEAHKFVSSQESILDNKIENYKKQLVHYSIKAEEEEPFLE